jgi:transcriptional regulator with XRE-family HTH domain
MRLFKDRAGLSPSYIHDIERGITLPSPGKLEAITSVLREVASEQGANPDADADALFRAREETIYIDRLGVDPELAEVFIALRELDDDTRAEITEPVLKAVELFSGLEPRLQRSVATVLVDAIAVVKGLDGAERNRVGFAITESVEKVIAPVLKKFERADEDAVPRLPNLRTVPTQSATETRARQHTGS